MGVPDLLPGESRGYWKYHAPGKWFQQAKVGGKINNEKATMLLDSGAEVSILDTAFARKVGCHINRNQIQDCVGIGENVYTTNGRAQIKITLAGCLVYCFDIWVGDLADQDAILGMDFMVPAGVRLDLADGTMCFPDEMRIQVSGRHPLYGEKMRIVRAGKTRWIEPGEIWESPERLKRTDREKLWVIRGERWVPTVVRGPGRSQYLQITNISEEKKLLLDSYEEIGMWLALDSVPRSPGYVSVGSRRYREWQNLAYEATTESRSEDMDEQPEEPTGPLVERPVYPTPRKILQRGQSPRMESVAAIEDQGRGALLPVSEDVNGSRTSQESHPSVSELSTSEILSRPTSTSITREEKKEIEVARSKGLATIRPDPPSTCKLPDLDPTPDEDLGHTATDHTHAEGLGATEDEQICYHEGGDLYAEDVGEGMAVVPDVPLTTEEVKIEDIQLDPTSNTPEEVNRLRDGIWRFKHLLIGKGNALPPAVRGVVCDIDVGGAKPIAQKVRKVAPQFREKLLDLIKGLLNAKIIRFSTSPLVNSLTRLMVYPMPLINELLEDLDKMLWYCSLYMASGFWVARAISAFITSFGLFEWNRMPFGLKNAPQIYQRLLDNVLYSFTRIPRRGEYSEVADQFEEGEPGDRRKASVLGRRSYIDDILVPARSWGQLCDRVDALLKVCDRWNRSISVAKSY
ncbi:hypothetical protein PC128_g19090 [Phytophthora cactorum]|nr:hypothetical protein PC128_g19090 [Phytophthora cactorum]